MIAEIAIGAAIVASVTYAFRTLSAAKRDMRAPEDAPKETPKRAGPRGLRVGDVLLYAETELWLAGMFELDEEGLVARVFRAPGNSAGDWVVQLDAEAEDIAIGRETDEVPDGRVPTELPVRGMRVSLRRRADARVTHAGDNLPPISESAQVVLMGGAGGRTLLVVDFAGAGRLSLDLERVGREMIELLPGGDDDDES